MTTEPDKDVQTGDPKEFWDEMQEDNERVTEAINRVFNHHPIDDVKDPKNYIPNPTVVHFVGIPPHDGGYTCQPCGKEFFLKDAVGPDWSADKFCPGCKVSWCGRRRYENEPGKDDCITVIQRERVRSWDAPFNSFVPGENNETKEFPGEPIPETAECGGETETVEGQST